MFTARCFVSFDRLGVWITFVAAGLCLLTVCVMLSLVLLVLWFECFVWVFG